MCEIQHRTGSKEKSEGLGQKSLPIFAPNSGEKSATTFDTDPRSLRKQHAKALSYLGLQVASALNAR